MPLFAYGKGDVTKLVKTIQTGEPSRANFNRDEHHIKKIGSHLFYDVVVLALLALLSILNLVSKGIVNSTRVASRFSVLKTTRSGCISVIARVGGKR